MHKHNPFAYALVSDLNYTVLDNSIIPVLVTNVYREEGDLDLDALEVAEIMFAIEGTMCHTRVPAGVLIEVNTLPSQHVTDVCAIDTVRNTYPGAFAVFADDSCDIRDGNARDTLVVAKFNVVTDVHNLILRILVRTVFDESGFETSIVRVMEAEVI